MEEVEVIVNRERFERLTSRYAGLRVAVAGDFCLDRYLEIDPGREERSIETGLPVHNVVRVRSQPGGAGTILNNLVALGVGRIYPIGFCGADGEGYELMEALRRGKGVDTRWFLQTNKRRTFTYTKPLLIVEGAPPRELSRLDFKNWSATPGDVEEKMAGAVAEAGREVDAMIVLDQVDVEGTGVVTQRVKEQLPSSETVLVLADSRRGLSDFPKVGLKMNAVELGRLLGWEETPADVSQIRTAAVELSLRNRRPVFVTMAERGIVGADAAGGSWHVAARPCRGEIDVVGAGDAVTANLAAALAAGAELVEAMELAMRAASVVVHQLGTTGVATVEELGVLRREAE